VVMASSIIPKNITGCRPIASTATRYEERQTDSNAAVEVLHQ
jgi:hypothetical protein